MKTLFLVIFFKFSLQVSAQDCGCTERPELQKVISCRKTIFSNDAKIYWNYNCNSSSIIFENKTVKRIVFTLEKELQDLTGRLGFISRTETKNHFIIKNKTISGCCEPLEIYQFNKNNGAEEKNLGTLIFENDSGQNQFIVTLLDLNTLLFYEMRSDINFRINLTKGRIENTMKKNGDLHAEDYFHDIKLEKGIFTMKYTFLDKHNKWKNENIKIDLKK